MKIIIVGAGLAGLVCGRTLARAGHEVVILEASDGVGGRVRSDVVEGFTLDRGFQVLFTAYPAAQRQFEYSRLNFRIFEPGALIAKGEQRHTLTDPSRDISKLLPTALTPIVTLKDKIKTLQLAIELKTKSIEQIISGLDETTENYVRRYGFSEAYLNNFIRPFYGGIFLDSSMQTSAKAFKFDFKMLADGQTVIPAGGMGQLSAQIAEELNARKAIRLNTKVTSLLQENERYNGVTLADGEMLRGDAVVLAVPAPEAARLTGLTGFPEGQTSTINVYLAGNLPVYKDKKIALNANPGAFVNNAVQVTNIAPEYAPVGKQLLSATILGVPEASDSEIYERTLADLRTMFNGDAQAQTALNTYRLLKIYRIPYAQFAQPAGIHPTLPDNSSGVAGLYYASEFTEASSLNAAMISGEKAAGLILKK